MQDKYKKTYSTEKQLTTNVKRWLSQQPDLYFWKASERYVAGVADIIACVQGVFVALELKDDTGKLSANQRLFGKKIEQTGGIFKECRCVQDVIDAVNAARERN